MTQGYVLSEQTRKELTTLFTKTQTASKLSEDDVINLVFSIDQTVSVDFNPRGVFVLCTFLYSSFHGIGGIATLCKHHDDYRKSITNQTEAKQVCKAVLTIAKVFTAQCLTGFYDKR